MSTDDHEDYPEGHDVVLHKGPCPQCGSSDNLVTYADGHAHCFSPGCTFYTAIPRDRGEAVEEDQADAGGLRGPGVPHHDQNTRHAPEGTTLLDPRDFKWAVPVVGKRKIKPETYKRYGYFLGRYAGQDVHVAPLDDQEGELVAQKLRWPNKDFTTLKSSNTDLSKCRLFGHRVYGDKFDKMVVVTEGELDTMTVAQACDFKFPVVSINSGAQSAAKNLKANYLWLDRFSQIVLWFDDDEPGRLATEECAKLFKVGKVRVAKLAGCKDASDALQQDRPGDIFDAVYMATAWRPKGIVNAADLVSDVLAPKEADRGWDYPPTMSVLQEMTGGIFKGEVIYHVAGTGVGKSTALREMQYHLVEQQVRIGVLSFEDTRRDMQLGLMSIKAGKRLHLEPLPDGEMAELHRKVFGSRLVEMFDPETAEWSVESIMGYVRYCAKALDCGVIFLDPLSFIAAGMSLQDDERRVLDKASRDLAALAKELGVNIQVSHHLTRTQGVPHEEGAATSLNQVRGSGGLANFASCVIGWERNNQAEGELWRVTRSRVLKPARRIGRSGIADTLFYEPTGRLVPTTHEFPEPGKSGAEQPSGKPFASLGASKDY